MNKRLILGFGLFLTVVTGSLLFSSKPAAALSDDNFRNGVYTLTSADTIRATIEGKTYQFKDTNFNDGNLNFQPSGNSQGPGDTICSWGPASGDREDYGITLGNRTPNGNYPARINLKYSFRCSDEIKASVTVTSAAGVGQTGTPAGTPAAATPAAANASENSCYRNSGPLTFILCPLIDGADWLVNEMNDFIEGRLFFDREKFLTDQVKQSWSIIKNMATVMLVIIMLVMVISQAIGSGPFDAYTVRRVLPRLAIAAIAMQVSWYLLYFVIKLFNDLGGGISELMFAPFGGSEKMSLEALLSGADAPAGFGLFAGATVAGALIAAAINPFGIFLLIYSVLVFVAIAFFVLLLRDMLLILAIIVSPIAIGLWILPRTNRYWNLWQETLEKLLLMFPLIMGLIAAGRIFAYTAVSGDNVALDLGAFIIVLMGVFGPLILVPKTFQWGGQIMGTLAGMVNDPNKGVFDRPRKFLQGRQQELKSERTRQAALRVRDGKPSLLRGDKFRTGEWDPTVSMLGRSAKARKFAQFVEAGQKVEEQDIEASATTLKARTQQMSRGDAVKYLTDQFDSSFQQKGHEADLQAISGILANLRAGEELEGIRGRLAGSNRHQEWNQMVGRNFGAFQENSPHLANGYTQESDGSWSIDDLRPFGQKTDSQLASMSSFGWEKYAQLDPTAAAARLARIAGNDNVSSLLNPGARAAVESGSSTGGTGTTAAAPRQRLAESQAADTAAGRSSSGTSRSQFENMNEPNLRNWIQGRGGIDKLSNRDLNVIYNAKRGDLQREVKDELNKRGIFNPEPSPIPTPPPPSAPPTGGGGGTPPSTPPPPAGPSSGSIPPDDFGPGGRFPPPSIPPSGS